MLALRGITNGLNSIGFAFRSPTSALPLGLSFYAFQVISYVADVYRGKVKAGVRSSICCSTSLCSRR